MLTRQLILATALFAAAAPVAATSQKLAPIPNSHKYSDRGAQPARAQAGATVLEAQALLDSAGMARLSLNISPGVVDKLQVKVFHAGKLVANDNYAKVAGATTLNYAGLARGDRIELQANVKGARGATEVANIATEVKLGPDLEPGIQAPVTVDYRSPFSVVGRVREANGDVGARFDCRLFADDVQVSEILGAWVDAGQEVACHFTTSFASLGSKRLVVRADGVTPGDYDAGNNAVYADLQVMAKGFQSSFAWYVSDWSQSGHRIWTTRWNFGPPEIIEDYTTWEWPWRQQTYGMSATQDGTIAANGRVMLRHFMDATELEPIVADVADLGAHWDPACRSGYFGNGSFVLFCAYADSWYVETRRISSNTVIYIPTTGNYVQPAEEIAQGSTYRAELTYIDAANARQASSQGDITLKFRSAGWSDAACTFEYTYDGWAAYQTCGQSYFAGEQYGFYHSAP